ncbi:hypothetical protein BLOT_015534 [Blomia tropicalis]|nr:hypothetical protein BLOT_015534 [Blomia tropicalis]
MGNIEPDQTIKEPRQVHILHFNDCYNVESRSQEPVGGAARFVTALDTFQHLRPLVLFSGDIIAPSIMSTFTKGEQMLPVLERCNIDCALFGNHEFDFGLDYLTTFAKRTKFPWLMSNAFVKNTLIPLGEGKITHITEYNGVRIGLIGLIEEEWLYTLVLDPNDIHYVSFITEGRKLARSLKENDNVDMVIALTHMRTHNDIKLAEQVDEIDLILGGHDHDYDIRIVNGKYIIKSGTDFRQFSKITLNLGKHDQISSDVHHPIDVKIETIDVTMKYDEDRFLVKELSKYRNVIEDKMEHVIAMIDCDLDGRFASIRSMETNLGNMVADIMLDASIDGDFALLNSGTLRSDRIHPRGPFKMRDLVTILPYMESILVLEITGEQVHKALENSVSQYPKLEGRFPQVSGICFAFDPSRSPGNRVPYESIRINGNELIRERIYRMVTKEFISQGKDGYDVLKQCPIYKTTEQCMPMTVAVQNYFEATALIQAKKIQKTLTNESNNNCTTNGIIRRKSIISLRRQSKTSDEDLSATICQLNPKLDGRIRLIQPSS